MSNFLLDFPWDDYCFRTRNPDLTATAVGEVMDSGMRAYIPYSLTTFSPSKPWFDRACSSAISDREGAHRSYQASPSELTHAAFISARNRCSAKLRRAPSSFRKRKIDKLNSSRTEKCFWSLSKKIFNNFCNSSYPSLIRPDGSIACSPTDKANLFGSYFSANSSLSDSNAPDPPPQPLSNPIPSIIISARKVRRVLRSLKTNKASGPDGILPRFLKEFADELAPVLCRLFHLILISCTYPSSWKHALVQPVPKKGDRSNSSNYRPIALTLTVAKVFETLLNSHFIKHLESNNILSDHQYGFRKARSTGDLLSYLTHVWSSSLRNFGESFVIALDISKAFDRVWHKALLAKLPAYGFTPSFLAFYPIALYLLLLMAQPLHPSQSPVVFLRVLSFHQLFINDLLHATASDVHSFADDSNLYKSSSFQCQPSSNARSQSRLAMSSTINSDLQSISEWGTRNLVKFNTSETQLLTISLSDTPSNNPIIFDDSEIPPLNSVNILGLQISSSLSWRDHIVQIAKLASKKLGVLFRCRQYFSAAQLFKLYTGFIRPCLEYCSHIWGSSPYTSLLDRIESKAIRLIGDPSLTSTLDPLSLRRKVASLSLFYRYYFGHCSDELTACIPPPMARSCSTRQATFAHNYCVALSNARINRFSDGFFPSTSHLWNSLPSSVFPAYFNLPSFKWQVYRHLRDQMA